MEKNWEPSLEEYSPGITKEKWIEILNDKNITTDKYLTSFSRILDAGGVFSCTGLSEKYGNTVNYYNKNICQDYPHSIDKFAKNSLWINEKGSRWWPLLFQGRDADTGESGSLMFMLRQELKEALESIDLSQYSLYESQIGKSDFTWIPIYHELALKILTYKNKRSELSQIVYGLEPVYISYLKWKPEGVSGSDTPEIDPFSIFAIFNRGIKDSNRVEILKYFKKSFNLVSDIPTDFDSIPLFNNQKSFFTTSNADSFQEDIEILWSMFESALDNDDNMFRNTFNKAVERWGNGMLTMALYWVAPNTFLALDSKNKVYLKKNNINIPNKVTFQTYNDLLAEVRESMQKTESKFKSYPELSHLAYIESKTGRKYWSGGIKWGEEDKKAEFISNNYWQIGWSKADNSKGAKQAWKNIKNIEIGDYLSFHSYGGQNDLTIHYLAEITDVNKEEGKLIIEKLPGENYYKGKGPKMNSGNWFGTLLSVTGNEAVETIFNITSNGEIEMDNTKLNPYSTFLTKHHNIIFHGAPGTGKTYLAKKIAEAMDAETEFVQFHPSYDYTDFVEGLRPISNSDRTNMIFERRDGAFKAFCKKAAQNLIDSQKSTEEVQAEISFKDKYFDLLDKIRNGEIKELQQRSKTPLEIIRVTDNDNIVVKTKASDFAVTYTVSYERLEKLSKGFSDKQSLENIKNIDKEIRSVIGGCHTSSYWATLYWIYTNQDSSEVEAISFIVKEKKFVFIIDEINRGEISKIFGELFFSIDPGYRGESGLVKTQYQNLVEPGDIFEEGFYVPSNVYIIGTMNDIDRSVECMDFAMRRRFAFKEITAAQSAENFGLSEETIKRMESLNEAINKIEELNSSYHIGSSYFKELDEGKETADELWDNSLYDLLTEYLKGSGNEPNCLEVLQRAFNLETDE